LVTYGCHRTAWLWCPGRCSVGPAALSSPASCSGSTGSSCPFAPGRRWTPPQTQNSAGTERCPVRIPTPGEAHRSEIRAVAPPWHRGGCDHNQVSRERAVLPSSGPFSKWRWETTKGSCLSEADRLSPYPINA
ncbi:hypothetical protein GOODEAATRI_011283, partial [Goodea atripinnis]